VEFCAEFYCKTRRSSVRYTASFDQLRYTTDSSSSPTASINESTENNGQTIKPKFQTRRENVKLRKRNGGRAVQVAALVVIHLLVLRAC